MAKAEKDYMISEDLINEIIASNTIRDQDVQDRVIDKLQNLVRVQDEVIERHEGMFAENEALTVVAKAKEAERKKSGF